MYNTANNNPDPLLSPEETARYLNRDIRTLANDRSKGEGPDFIKLGGLIRYAKSSLDKHIADSTIILKK
jgi:hypothetical protein